MQNNVICSEEKIINTLKEVIQNHGLIEELTLTPSVINDIIETYNTKANYMKEHYVIGDLDTFKVASCLMVAINSSLDIEDEVEKAQIALDVVYAFIEKPYYNVGINFNIPTPLEEINLAESFKDEKETFEESNNNLLKSLILGKKAEPLNYFNVLELLYNLALLLKHKNNDMEEPKKVPIPKKRFRDLFKRKKA